MALKTARLKGWLPMLTFDQAVGQVFVLVFCAATSAAYAIAFGPSMLAVVGIAVFFQSAFTPAWMARMPPP